MMRYFEMLSLFSVWLMLLMAAEGASGKLARYTHIDKKNQAIYSVKHFKQ